MLGLKVINTEREAIATEELDSVKIYQQDGVDLSLSFVLLKFKEKVWEPYAKKLENILHEIWETEEVKNYYSLDSSCPANNQPRSHAIYDQCGKYIGDRKLTFFSDAKKDLDFCQEDCYSKWKEHNKLVEELKKETNNKTTLMVIVSEAAVIILFTTLFLVFWLRKEDNAKRK